MTEFSNPTRWPEFDEEIFRRTPAEVRARARELDALTTEATTSWRSKADRIPGAWVDVVDGAGHFVWVETPGAVRASLRRLTAVRPAPFG